MSYYDFDQERKIQDLQRQVDLMYSQQEGMSEAQRRANDWADIQDLMARAGDKTDQAIAQFERGKISKRKVEKIFKESNKDLKMADKRMKRLKAHPDRPSDIPSPGRENFFMLAGAVIGFILGRWVGLIIGALIGLKIANIGYK